jgi:hypothetical protein
MSAQGMQGQARVARPYCIQLLSHYVLLVTPLASSPLDRLMKLVLY